MWGEEPVYKLGETRICSQAASTGRNVFKSGAVSRARQAQQALCCWEGREGGQAGLPLQLPGYTARLFSPRPHQRASLGGRQEEAVRWMKLGACIWRCLHPPGHLQGIDMPPPHPPAETQPFLFQCRLPPSPQHFLNPSAKEVKIPYVRSYPVSSFCFVLVLLFFCREEDSGIVSVYKMYSE